MQKTRDAVKNIAPGKETAKDLGVPSMDPFAAKLPGVLALHQGKVVANLRAIIEFVNIGLEEEGLAKSEVWKEAGRGVGYRRRIDGFARTSFTRIGEMRLVQHGVGKRADPVRVDGLDMGRAFDSVRGSAVRGNVEGLIGILGPVKVVGTEDLVLGIQVVIHAAKNGGVALFMNNGKAFVGVLERSRKSRGVEEIQKCHALAFSAAGDDPVIHADDRSCDGTRGAKRSAQSGTIQIFADAFTCGEEEEFVFDERAAETAAKLVAAKTIEGLAIRSGGSERFRAEVLKKCAVIHIGAGLRDDVDDTTGAAAELCVGAARGDLKFLDGFQCDVNGRALAAHLLTEESVIVVAAIEADVVEDAALAVDVDFVAVRTLRNTDAGSERKQIFELAAENRSRSDRYFVEGGRGFRFCDFYNWHVGDDDLLRDRRNLHGDGQRDGLPDGEVHVFLNDCGEPGFTYGKGVAPRRHTQERKMPIGVSRFRLSKVGIQILGFDGCTRDASALLIKNISLNGSRADLRLSPPRRGKAQREC